MEKALFSPTRLKMCVPGSHILGTERLLRTQDPHKARGWETEAEASALSQEGVGDSAAGRPRSPPPPEKASDFLQKRCPTFSSHPLRGQAAGAGAVSALCRAGWPQSARLGFRDGDGSGSWARLGCISQGRHQDLEMQEERLKRILSGKFLFVCLNGF